MSRTAASYRTSSRGGAPAAGEAPFARSGHSQRQILSTWTLAATLVACGGIVLFGFAAAETLSIALVVALASELGFSMTARRPRDPGVRRAALIGLLVGLTLPPGVAWYVPACASLIAIAPANWMLGGSGHLLWQPALVGRVMVQFLFAQQLSLDGALLRSPVLARDRLLLGDLAAAQPVDPGAYQGWRHTPSRPGADALLLERPVQTLRRIAAGRFAAPNDTPLTRAIRDELPPWRDTVVGTVPGGIGESCSIGLIVAALYLIHRGYLRWQLPVAGLLAAALTAAILPIHDPDGARWLPGLAQEEGHPVGLLYVLFHLTSGQLLLGLALFAGDMVHCPLTRRGQMIFAVLIGTLTIVLRIYGPLAGECYWSILVANTLVPVIDTHTRRRPLSAPPVAAT